MRSIIVAFPDTRHISRIKDVLVAGGLHVSGEACSGSMTLCQATTLIGGGVVICGPLFQDMSAGHLQTLLPEEYDMLVLASPGSLNIGYEHTEGLYTLSLPLRSQDLLSSVRMLLETRQMASNTLYAKKIQKAPDAPAAPPGSSRSPEEKRTIERAKAILMNRNQMSEQEAHRFLQKKSMDNGWRLLDTALAVIKTMEK